MKKTLIGGFLTLSGTIGIVILLVACILNPVTRLICTMLEHGIAVPIGCFLIIFITGLFILGIEYRKKI